MRKWEVTAQESGQKLTVFLKNKLGEKYSSRRIKQAIEHNACRLNGRIERFGSTTVGKGDSIQFDEVEESPRQSQRSVEILYQDSSLLAINKPAGLASDDPALMPMPGLQLLHRLDKDTTGVLLWAKNDLSTQKIFEAFKKREIGKVYLAIVDGVPQESKGHIENFLGKLHQYQGQSLWGVVPRDRGVTAITDWQVDQKLGHAALVRCFPRTGRTHQIRVHLSGLGHPILGDRQYGKRFSCHYPAARCLLHAYQVEFSHPETGKKMVIVAPLPDDFKQAIATLGCL